MKKMNTHVHAEGSALLHTERYNERCIKRFALDAFSHSVMRHSPFTYLSTLVLAHRMGVCTCEPFVCSRLVVRTFIANILLHSLVCSSHPFHSFAPCNSWPLLSTTSDYFNSPFGWSNKKTVLRCHTQPMETISKCNTFAIRSIKFMKRVCECDARVCAPMSVRAYERASMGAVDRCVRLPNLKSNYWLFWFVWWNTALFFFDWWDGENFDFKQISKRFSPIWYFLVAEIHSIADTHAFQIVRPNPTNARACT